MLHGYFPDKKGTGITTRDRQKEGLNHPQKFQLKMRRALLAVVATKAKEEGSPGEKSTCTLCACVEEGWGGQEGGKQ